MASSSLKERLTEILIEGGLLQPEELDKAIAVQREKGGKLATILAKLGFVKERDLLAALGKSLNIPSIDLSKFKIDEKLIKTVPEQIARRYRIIPISRVGNTLTIAVADPLNVFTLDDLKILTRFELRPVIVSEKQIQEAFDQHYHRSTSEAVQDILSTMEGEGGVELLTEEEEQLDKAALLKLVGETPVVKITNMLLTEAVRKKASDILIEPGEKSARVRYRIDGVLQERDAPPKKIIPALVSRIKVMAELDIAERRLPQDGRFKINILERAVDFRVSVLPTSFGEKIALRVLDKTTVILDVDKLGFEKSPLKNLKEASLQPHGMILACGPTGCGKTTTLYSILKHIDTPQKNISTAEDPIEFELPGINQVAVRSDIGLTFAAALRSFLRQDPDIIMVGEIRDFETVDIAVKAALTGHLVLSTLHTTDAAGSIVRLVDMGVEPFLIASSCLAVGAQRLIRALCPNCREEYPATPELIKELHLKKEGIKKLVFYRAKGCLSCGGMGYRGRVGIIEVLSMTAKIKESVMVKATEAQIKEIGRREGMATLRENGLAKALRGITSLEEVLRVTAPDEPMEG